MQYHWTSWVCIHRQESRVSIYNLENPESRHSEVHGWFKSSAEPWKMYTMLRVSLGGVFSVFHRVFTLYVICLLAGQNETVTAHSMRTRQQIRNYIKY